SAAFCSAWLADRARSSAVRPLHGIRTVKRRASRSLTAKPADSGTGSCTAAVAEAAAAGRAADTAEGASAADGGGGEFVLAEALAAARPPSAPASRCLPPSARAWAANPTTIRVSTAILHHDRQS